VRDEIDRIIPNSSTLLNYSRSDGGFGVGPIKRESPKNRLKKRTYNTKRRINESNITKSEKAVCDLYGVEVDEASQERLTKSDSKAAGKTIVYWVDKNNEIIKPLDIRLPRPEIMENYAIKGYEPRPKKHNELNKLISANKIISIYLDNGREDEILDNVQEFREKTTKRLYREIVLRGIPSYRPVTDTEAFMYGWISKRYEIYGMRLMMSTASKENPISVKKWKRYTKQLELELPSIIDTYLRFRE
jgi:hypothetical protein